jgi:hypothetical protein
MYEVYKQTLTEQINKAKFVSIEADETIGISFMSQFVIYLRYCNSIRLLEEGSIQEGSLLLTNIQLYSWVHLLALQAH